MKIRKRRREICARGYVKSSIMLAEVMLEERMLSILIRAEMRRMEREFHKTSRPRRIKEQDRYSLGKHQKGLEELFGGHK